MLTFAQAYLQIYTQLLLGVGYNPAIRKLLRTKKISINAAINLRDHFKAISP